MISLHDLDPAVVGPNLPSTTLSQAGQRPEIGRSNATWRFRSHVSRRRVALTTDSSCARVRLMIDIMNWDGSRLSR